MKTRQGFISNSSSSSFVIIGKEDPVCEGGAARNGYFFHKYKYGEYEFGWGPDTITDQTSRINFAFIQAYSVRKNHPEWVDMVKTAIKEVSNSKEIYVDFLFDENCNLHDCYIDHQSAAIEGENTEIFDDMDTLKRFLFSPDSYIVLDNDNH